MNKEDNNSNINNKKKLTLKEKLKDKINEKKEPSSEEVIASLQEEMARLKNDVARAYADTENMKKRLQKEADTAKKYRFQQAGLELLPILDNMGMALNVQSESEELKNYVKGFEMIYQQLQRVLENEGVKEINVILKADVKGSEEAVKNSLLKINVDGVKINIIRSSIGAISESDIVLANASNAIIIGFNIRPDNKIVEYAKSKNVDIRLYNIIYKLVEEIESAMRGVLDPEYVENILGSAEVRKLFKFSKVGTIAGCYVLNGIIKRNAKARIIRDGIVIYDGNVGSIAREKDQVKEVKEGLECGITIENYNDIKEKDIIEAYEIVLKK